MGRSKVTFQKCIKAKSKYRKAVLEVGTIHQPWGYTGNQNGGAVAGRTPVS